MGDCVDRGRLSLNNFFLLATHKRERPRHFFLLRRNHEARQVTQQDGFRAEILALYGHTGLSTKCMRLFDLLPIAAVTDTDVFFVQGGLSPSLVL
jgi:uncharacterized protein (UPF0128 family)